MAQPSLVRNPVSLAGAWLTTLAAFAFLTYLAVDQAGWINNPYAGLYGFVLTPTVFLGGLLLMPVGIWREGRRRAAGKQPWHWPVLDLEKPRTRRVLLAVAVLTLVNLAITGIAGVGAAHYMETDRFCGQVCHEPMRPEFTAHQQGVHANVACTSCHIAPGPSGMVRAKLNGTRQAYEALLRSYNRPIPSPARGLPLAADTCDHCHSSALLARDVTRVIPSYGDDETNTENLTTLLMASGKTHAWHAKAGVRIEYVATDATRETIPYIRTTDAAGRVTEYFADKTTSAPVAQLRRMDCLDCHNRPAHTFSGSAERAVDRAMADGWVNRTIPFVHREMVAALTTAYPDARTAATAIGGRLADFYRSRGLSGPLDVARTIEAARRLYAMNVFPEMKVTWGTYLTWLGHIDAPGCFRCHDDTHKATDGRVVRQDCELCHRVQ
jgi:hypothetical protein